MLFFFSSLLLLSGCGGNSTPLEHGVYVWQRLWNENVTAAVRAIDADLTVVLPLAAEISFPDPAKGAETRWIKTDHAALKSAEKPVISVIRIGASAAATNWNAGAIRDVLQVVAALESPGVQIDYDCPQSKLGDYAKLLDALSAQTGAENLSFTALPSWLDDPEAFKALAAYVDHFVLQVHALNLPETSASPPELISPERARLAVKRAASIGTPFYVALPTYGSFVIFDRETKKIIEVVSEDLPNSWPDRVLAKLALAAPDEMANLVAAWSKKRPSTMRGIYWYRLPVRGDLLNWPDLTWRKVRRGTAPVRRWTTEKHPGEGGITTIHLKNSGEQPEPVLPGQIILAPASSIHASEGSSFFQAQKTDNAIILQRFPTENDLVPLPVGKSIQVGWIRTDSGPEIIVKIRK